MKLFLFSLLNFYIISVYGFFYTLLPLTVIKKDDNTFKAYCPWNQTSDQQLECKVNKSVMGYFRVKSGDPKTALPEPTEFLNPALQKGFTADKCADIKKNWAQEKSNGTACSKYSFCHNIAEDANLCSCQNGFFGNPYSGCMQHCKTDDDCSSPLAVCASGTHADELKRCKCKDGFDGDGVFCYKNVCGDDRRAKCGSEAHKVCVPTGSGETDYECVCEPGYYLDHENKCKVENTVTENTVITLVGKNIKDGSRVELGDCLSFLINDKTKSVFYHKNSGDSIYVKSAIMNDNQFSIFFVVTKEIIAYTRLNKERFGLSKLYSVTNTFLGCKFANGRIIDPEGHDLSENASGDTSHRPAVPPPASPQLSPSVLQSESRPEVSTLEYESFLETAEQEGPEAKVTLTKPTLEVYVRNLTEDERAGGLAGTQLSESMLELASQDLEQGEEGLELGRSKAKDHPAPSNLQVTLPPESSRTGDL